MALDVTRLRAELEDILKFLPSYVRNPVEGVRTAPELSWPALLSVQTGVAAASGAVGGLISLNFWNFLAGIFIFPISSLFQVVVIAFFLQSFFALTAHRHLDRQRLFGVVVLANLPYLVLHAMYGWIPAIDLIGFLATCVLLIVGVAEHFRIDRRLLIKLIGGVYALFFLIWGISQYRAVTRIEERRGISAPKALDTLESELQND
ncbi:MAG: hypothetical protein NDI61_13720 [Bdellovibrionaceae bacterium]|nr:hypothetical protein [Pseudobdellovibrionaceae bacterium]